jgi:hypothetical protein
MVYDISYFLIDIKRYVILYSLCNDLHTRICSSLYLSLSLFFYLVSCFDLLVIILRIPTILTWYIDVFVIVNKGASWVCCSARLPGAQESGWMNFVSFGHGYLWILFVSIKINAGIPFFFYSFSGQT